MAQLFKNISRDDKKKMYRTVKIKMTEQHTHRFLWREMDHKRQPDTYVIQRVLSVISLQKWGQDKYPKAAKVIKENTYMEDVIESVSDKFQFQFISNFNSYS